MQTQNVKPFLIDDTLIFDIYYTLTAELHFITDVHVHRSFLKEYEKRTLLKNYHEEEHDIPWKTDASFSGARILVITLNQSL